MDVEKVVVFCFPKKLVLSRKSNFSLGKSWFFRSPGSKNQHFPRKKLVFHKNTQAMDRKNQLFLRKKLVFQKSGLLKPSFS